MDFQTGIYEILNTRNGKVYIGSAAKLKTRKRDHFNLLKTGKHHSRYLQATWNKYGEESFIFKILLYCSKENLISYEQLCIDNFNPSYNVNKNAGSRLGMYHTPETKALIAEKNSGRVVSQETREKLSRVHRGVPKSQEHIQKLVQIKTGMKRSIESRKRMSDAQIGKPWSVARRQAQESRAQLKLIGETNA